MMTRRDERRENSMLNDSDSFMFSCKNCSRSFKQFSGTFPPFSFPQCLHASETEEIFVLKIFPFSAIFHRKSSRQLMMYTFIFIFVFERLGVRWTFTFHEINNKRLDIVLDSMSFFPFFSSRLIREEDNRKNYF